MMNVKKRFLSAIVSLGLLITFSAGCGSPQEQDMQSQQSSASATTSEQSSESTASLTSLPDYEIDTFVIGSTMDLRSIARLEYYYNVFSGTITHMAPTRLDENEISQPLLCDFSTEDAKTWKFTINDDYTWHDGKPVTSEDVKFTHEIMKEQYTVTMFGPIEQINIIDEKSFEFVYAEPNIRAISLHAFRILPKHIFEGKSLESYDEPDAAIGCGPYKYVRFDKEAGIIEFEAYEDYPGGPPNIKKIYLRLFKNTDTMYMALKAGEIDMIWHYSAGVDSSVVEDLRASGNISLTPLYNTGNPFLILFNYQKEPVSDLRFRKAVAAAIDYDKCIELFGTEFSRQGHYGLIPEYANGYIPTEPLVRDLDKAKAFLAEMGAVDSNNDGMLELNGSPLEIELLTRGDLAYLARVSELLEGNLKDVGIGVNIKSVDLPTFNSIVGNDKAHVATLQRFTAAGVNTGGGMNTSYLDARTGDGNVDDPEFLELVDKMNAAVTMDEWLGYAKTCQEFYAENIPAISLFQDSYIQAYNSRYGNFSIDGMFGLVNQLTWYSITAQG